MRNGLVVLWMLLCSVAPATAQVTVGISLSLYPDLVPIAGYPVYYAPRLDSNYFFYDGMYWIYQGDNWYASSWYNGPWMLVGPEAVPLYILRVPVRYYRHPPAYFHGWRSNAPPRWDEHWGSDWSQRRRGWDQWNRRSAPPPAPLPAYQRKYAGDRYPQAEQQQALQSKKYRYQPRDPEVRQHYQAQAVPQEKAAAPQALQRPNPPPPVRQNAPTIRHAQPARDAGENVQRAAPTQAPPPERRQPAQHPQQEPKSHGQEGAQGRRGPQDREQSQGAGQERGRENPGGGADHKQQ